MRHKAETPKDREQADSTRESQAASPTVLPSEQIHRSKSTPASPVGTRFGRYEILAELGAGGMGAVYKARDTVLDRNVALKLPKFSGARQAEMAERFRREASLAATLDHPSICRIFDAGEQDGQLYLTMALVEGRTLDDLLKAKGHLEPLAAARVIRKISETVSFAHRAGILHRDLKPANVMVCRDGQFVIMDFGLARRIDQDDEQLTADGQIMGTPAYMSPEQLRGLNQQVGARSDLYSLGIMLYQLVTGKRPFRGTFPEICAQAIAADGVNPCDELSMVPERLGTICQKATRNDPQDRYGDVAELVEALKSFQLRPDGLELEQEVEETPHKTELAPTLNGFQNEFRSQLTGLPYATTGRGNFRKRTSGHRNKLWGSLIGVGLVVVCGVIAVQLWTIAKKQQANAEGGQRQQNNSDSRFVETERARPSVDKQIRIQAPDKGATTPSVSEPMFDRMSGAKSPTGNAASKTMEQPRDSSGIDPRAQSSAPRQSDLSLPAMPQLPQESSATQASEPQHASDRNGDEVLPIPTDSDAATEKMPDAATQRQQIQLVATLQRQGVKITTTSVRGVTMVTEVDAVNQALSNSLIQQISLFENLRVLNLYGTKTTNRDLAGLSNLKQLEVLLIGATSVTDAGLKYLNNYPNLRHLNINDLPGLTGDGFQNVAVNLSQQRLEVGRTGITTKSLELISQKYPNLRHLGISVNSQVNRGFVHSIRGFKELESLNVRHTNCTNDDVQDAVQQFPKLIDIDAQLTHVTSDFAQRLRVTNPNIHVHH
ncbi:MAG: protein kinase [Pirellulaceae bacterium]|nr:protein kinase [Pirellulaceae bacterium]